MNVRRRALVTTVPLVLAAAALTVPRDATVALRTATPGGISAADASGAAALASEAMINPALMPENRMALAASLDALAQRDAALQRSAGVPAAAGTWHQYGSPPELDNTSDYKPIDATATMSGRVQDFAYDPATGRIFAAVGGGGIYVTRDMGAHWRTLTDGLPTTTAGAVGFSRAHGGTIIDGTGDSGYSYAGLGIFRSLDGGRTWQHARGVPNGLLTFRITVDPTNPNVVYAATSRGLYRSADDAASFVNVKLPTGTTKPGGPSCAGDTTAHECVFENYVTDVRVRPAGGGDAGGEVLASVGWYRGDHMTAQGWSNAPNNGIYSSPTGLPGSFVDTQASSHGFTSPRSHIGMTTLGVADGPSQNHDIVWAMVEDAQKVNGNLPGVDPQPDLPAACGVVSCYTSVLDNIYVSTDFGKTWTARLTGGPAGMALCPLTGTDQCGVLAAPAPVGSSYGPGVQAWYNNWIHVDPTQQDAMGAPTRLFFGLEEVWEADNPSGPAPFQPHSIGRYFGNGFCGETGIVVGPVDASNPPACPGVANAPTTTHPDQHGAILVPDRSGGVTLVVGNDGGIFTQHAAAGGTFDNAHWGNGANNGISTLLPYMAVMAKDGVAYAGLQDNGEIKVLPDGRVVEVFGGDGGYSAVDPDNSDNVYEEYVYDTISASTDGGRTWTGIFPGDTTAQFIAPLTIDPSDHNHLLTGGEFVEETVSGASTTQPQATSPAPPVPNPPSQTASTDAMQVFDTGSGNSLSATALRGDAAYAGFCGPCYIPSTVASSFKNGIVTNVGGDKPGQRMSSNGWHVAAAKGLPNRYVSSIAIDPHNARTIYVAMGAYDPTIDYRPPGAFGDDVSRLGRPGVYRSTDAGQTFHNISGDLPNAPANWVDIRGGQLVVATNVGVFLSSNLNGGSWALLGGRSLPLTPVKSVQVQPGNPNRLLVATYGRSLWVYDFPAGSRIGAHDVAAGSASARAAGAAAGGAGATDGAAATDDVLGTRTVGSATAGGALRSPVAQGAAALGLALLGLVGVAALRWRRRRL